MASPAWATEKETASKESTEANHPWYIYNGLQAGSFSTIFLPSRDADVIDTSYTRNYLFLSYRFSNNWIAFAGFAYQFFESDITSPSFGERFGDSLFGGSYRFLNTRFGSLATSLAVKVPLSDYPIENLSAQGDGQVDIKAALKYELQFGWLSRYNELEMKVGHNFRFESPADQLELNLDYRFYLFRFLALRVGGGYVHSYDGTEYGSQDFTDTFTQAGAGAAFISLKTRYLSYRAGFDVIPMNRLTLSFVYSQVISGENAADVTSFGVSAGFGF